MNKSITSVLLALLCLHGWNAAQAAPGPLDSIDSRFIAEHLPFKAAVDVDTDGASQTLPGCDDVKVFDVFEDEIPGQIFVAICKEDMFGPNSIEATIARPIAEVNKDLGRLPAPLAQSIRAGAEPVTVPLEDGRQGKALTLPFFGHGIALVPIAYGLTPSKDATIVVQAFLDSDKPRDLTKSIAALLQGIDKRLRWNRH